MPNFFARALLFDLDGTLIDSLGSEVSAHKGASKLLNSLPIDAWAIVTSENRLVAEAKLNKVSLPIPRVMITAENLEPEKPDPQRYLEAARKLRVRPQDTIVLDSAISGIEAAKRAGMQCVALRTTASDELLQDATEIIDDLTSLTAATYMRGLLLRIK